VLVENVLSTAVERWPTLLGLIFILVILFARAGIVGSIEKLIRRMRRRRRQGRSPDETAPRHEENSIGSNHTAGKELP
jgi:branched-chain amino acid transport system permease protein